MRIKKQKELRIRHGWRHRSIAALLVLSMLFCQININVMAAYATGSDSVSVQVGENVKGTLKNGVLTISGNGGMDDFSADTAPFSDYAEEIHSLNIEEGVTYIGAYVFYGLGGLKGELVLPESITGFGDYAFSGHNKETAPGYTAIRNLFSGKEIVHAEKNETEPDMTTEEDSQETETEETETEETEDSTSTAAEQETESSVEKETDSTQDGQEQTEEPKETQEQDEIKESKETQEPKETEGQKESAEKTESPEEAGEQEAHESAASVQRPELDQKEEEPQQEKEGVESLSARKEIQKKDRHVYSAVYESKSIPEFLSAGSSGRKVSLSTAPEKENTVIAAPAVKEQPTESTEEDETVENTDGAVTENPDTQDAETKKQIRNDSEKKQYTTSYITQQEIKNPDTLFYPGQSGCVICSEDNTSFLDAALAAGYHLADGTVKVILDDQIELEVTSLKGRIQLPECPEEISAAYEEDAFFSHTFSGWTEDPSEEGSSLLTSGSSFDTKGREQISLYSVWESADKYQFGIKKESKEKYVVYILIDNNTGEPVSVPEGYSLSYQWQIAQQGDADAVNWADIDGAVGKEYRRELLPKGSRQQLRCQVKAVRLMRARTNNGEVTFYSDPVDAAVVNNVIYVDQSGGDDNESGDSEKNAVKTLEQASDLLKLVDGKSVEENKIVLVSDYRLSDDECKNFPTKIPVTITGMEGNISLKGRTVGNDAYINLQEDICFENLKVETIQHIYGNGYDITIGEGIQNNLKFYLYGAGQGKVDKVGKINVYSGTVLRIVGYARSVSSVDVSEKLADITVGGTANIDKIIGGCANGEIKNGNVKINVKGGNVKTLVGGNQGFQSNGAAFTGKTEININGGKVQNLYAAGSGREQSVPTYSGTITINMQGGEVGNLYGAGSAAYVISDDGNPSTIKINMEGGIVTNIFAAGKGGDNEVKKGEKLSGDPSKFGSLTGIVNIIIDGEAVVTNIYASGEGYVYNGGDYDTSKNAYLCGNATITIKGNAQVKGGIYGGGKGITQEGFGKCARVTGESVVKLFVQGNAVIFGNIYGGGENAEMEGNAYVSLSEDCNIKGNLYGGGKNGIVMGKTAVEIIGGIVEGSVYGGALGITGQRLVYGGSTINMSAGWVKGNLYGGSELSDDGPKEGKPKDLIFVNLVGGTVSGNVFGGGYRGTVNGSTHLHIGEGASGECKYYQTHGGEKTELQPSILKVDGSVYAGGDYGGGDKIDYTTITVKGTSHVYIDGTGYNTGDADLMPEMRIAGGVFGSGASCDAGSTRLVTLKNYGTPVLDDSGLATGVTRSLEAIQRADRVVLYNSHIQLSGKSDVANPNQTTLYSLNRIGDHGARDGVAEGENSLVLQAGSTLILDSAVIETANFKSIDKDEKNVELDRIKQIPNTILFDTGTVFRVSYTDDKSNEVFGAVSGYAYMLAGDKADAYAYARIKKDDTNNSDGGFADQDGKELNYENVGSDYRYWRVKGSNAAAVRHTVLTAENFAGGSGNVDKEGYSVVTGSIELPPAEKGSSFTITKVIIPTGTLVLTDAAKNGIKGEWITSDINETPEASMDTDEIKSKIVQEKEKLKASPLTTFGLFMRIGSGFIDAGSAKGKVISTASASESDKNTVIGKSTATATDGGIPHIEFYLTYWNEGISSSKSLGMLEIELTRSGDNTKTTMFVEIVTKASTLADQTVDLYATQSGNYTGSLVIPSGASRNLLLAGVDKESPNLVTAGTGDLETGQFSITMQPVKSQGWNTSDLMTESYDLASYKEAGIKIGTTDSRYQAVIEFSLKNNPAFTPKEEPDKVILTLQDEGGKAQITLNIHWKKSVVKSIKTMPGREYNRREKEGYAEQVNISPNSALTVAFELGEATSSNDLWLELWNTSDNKIIALPEGTRLTLLGMSDFYMYEAMETEADGRLNIDKFYKMWGDGTLNSNIMEDTVLTFIVDFGSVNEQLPAGSYNLRLRNETGADTERAEFTIQNQDAVISLNCGDAEMYSKGKQEFTLSIQPNCDTRWQNGAAVVLAQKDDSDFPEGTVFRYEDKDYYPSGTKVYILLEDKDPHTISMDTVNSAGITPGGYELTAEVFPVGENVGTTVKKLTSVSYTVKPNPSYSLKAELAESSSRIASAGETITFIVSYSIENTEISPLKIEVKTRKKEAGGYENSQNWTVTGNDIITAGKGDQEIQVTVPVNITAGTYRLLFALGDQEVPYNIIVQ